MTKWDLGPECNRLKQHCGKPRASAAVAPSLPRRLGRGLLRLHILLLHITCDYPVFGSGFIPASAPRQCTKPAVYMTIATLAAPLQWLLHLRSLQLQASALTVRNEIIMLVERPMREYDDPGVGPRLAFSQL